MDNLRNPLGDQSIQLTANKILKKYAIKPANSLFLKKKNDFAEFYPEIYLVPKVANISVNFAVFHMC